MTRTALLSCFLLIPFARAADFRKDVAPVLEARCHVCHGAKQQMNNLRLDNATDAAKVIKAGDSAHSKLIDRISSTKTGYRMPPVGASLTQKEVAVFKEWIDSGAKWPDNYVPGGKPVLWSLRPVVKPAAPAVKQAAWIRNPIDAFVLSRLEQEGLTPSAEADKLTLLRRVSLDLTGLPPSTREIDAFLHDSSPDAYERAVDRLLASPHYGERWARPWLDLAHYADSDGYEKDQVRPYAWRYRNWVIDALNSGMPFDQFTVEQVAGDLLPNADVDQHVATGFFRNTLTNREAGVDRAEARYEQLVNRVNTLSTTWLGLTVGCAQCHDHKFDPISNKDFYQIFAFFDSADDEEVEAPLAGERERYAAMLPWYLGNRGHILEQYGISEMQKNWEQKLRQAIADPGKDLEWDFSVTSFRAMVDHAERLVKTPAEKRTLRESRLLTDYFLSNPGPENSLGQQDKDKVRAARAKVQELNAQMPSFTLAMATTNDPDYKKSFKRIKGDYRAVSDPVEPGGVSVLPAMHANGRPTRLDLAKWLVSKENPLTARVAVNRIWQEFFGKGIVRTSEDFGSQGDKPTHPELLDFLASQFMDDGWSMKKLDRLIVTSATYRQTSKARTELSDRDPENVLLARQARMRMPAELIRDAALSASGLLDDRIGGPSVRPFQPKGVAELGYGNSVKWVQSDGADRFRRGLYVHFQRTTPYPQLMNFDAPDSNVSCSRRRNSNTPLQSLNLLNDPVFFEAAQALGARIMKNAKGGFAERLDYAYLLVLARKPDVTERERFARYYDQQLGILGNDSYNAAKVAGADAGDQKEAAAWVGVSRVLLNLDEFITRE